ncbi:protein TIC 22, chloroplastic [Amaranthus tricolor]|uniref:protein TIC 22, chloroplastic n=1 Tax=Amaranthus tricolor TaxID=29722 RepID=UPI002582ECA1|nr:protein TIC 22, chloroplastic [Amaranthus tricolor]XP_057549502.1 protein TIC 22, chloroplastic [Amaranthus tricolor]
MDSPAPLNNPLSTFIHQLGTELTTRLNDGRRLAGNLISTLSTAAPRRRINLPLPLSLPFASIGQAKQINGVALSTDNVAKTLAGTSVYTVSNDNNEFVLISDPINGTKSIGLLCFRKEDAEAFLAQAQLRRKELRSQAKVVPISLDQVYMLKVEGIAFRFLPDPVQIKNALDLKASETKRGFDGVPVFQSEVLVVKRKNKHYCPIYFRKEDLEKELFLKTSRGRGSHNIVVGSLEDILKKMEISEKNSGWDDFIFIPPGKSHTQHIQEVTKA